MEGEREISGGNRDVIHIDLDCSPPGLVLSNGVAVQSVHHVLECGRGISEAEEHHGGFIEPPSCLKHRLVFISGFDADVVVSPPHI